MTEKHCPDCGAVLSRNRQYSRTGVKWLCPTNDCPVAHRLYLYEGGNTRRPNRIRTVYISTYKGGVHDE